MDSELKECAENVIEQLGLNMTVVINMLFRQIVREQAIPLSLSLSAPIGVLDDLALAKADRAFQKAVHREYINDELDKSMLEANDPNTRWIPQNEMKERLARRREKRSCV